MSLPIFFYFLILSLFFKLSHSTTILVDGSSEWKNPTVSIGDSITFKHKQNYNLYIFKNQKAFNLCNFTQANLLTDPSTTSCSYTWHPSRVGFFYFTFSNDSLKACQDSQKLAIKVTPTKASAPEASSPMPTTPGPAPTPEASSPITVPLVPYKGSGDGMPFINSNPAVPLPTGEVDSATIHPLATSGHQGQVMIGLVGFHAAVHIMALLLL
ncbi:cupredoxin superfamily protein, putative [Medicago truncatula]|uniref:Cupredoxin superfamily protein, putative n=1 Tax=Medicago truncatula TaxID=3880 RepID=A0A072W011_MEDTR|nr:cupredoxin superfamily protein, putative [Medicago truncatula]